MRLNLANVTFIDSTGIHVVAEAIKKAKRDGWRFKIEPDLSPQVKSAFRFVKLDPVSSNNT